MTCQAFVQFDRRFQEKSKNNRTAIRAKQLQRHEQTTFSCNGIHLLLPFRQKHVFLLVYVVASHVEGYTLLAWHSSILNAFSLYVNCNKWGQIRIFLFVTTKASVHIKWLWFSPKLSTQRFWSFFLAWPKSDEAHSLFTWWLVDLQKCLTFFFMISKQSVSTLYLLLYLSQQNMINFLKRPNISSGCCSLALTQHT